jgi:hypothetical protein
MERDAVRLLNQDEIVRLVEACTSAKVLEETRMGHRVFDLSRSVAAEGDKILSETFRFISGVLTPSIEAIPKIETAANRFWIEPLTLTETERDLLRQLVEAVADPEMKRGSPTSCGSQRAIGGPGRSRSMPIWSRRAAYGTRSTGRVRRRDTNVSLRWPVPSAARSRATRQ